LKGNPIPLVRSGYVRSLRFVNALIIAATVDARARRRALLVVDTAPIIYVLEENPQFAPRFEPVFKAHQAGTLPFAVTTVTIAQALTGPMTREDRALVREYRHLLESWRVIPLDAEIAEEAAFLRVEYGFKLPDAVQAASARMIDAYALVTNDRGFSRLATLRVICSALTEPRGPSGVRTATPAAPKPASCPARKSPSRRAGSARNRRGTRARLGSAPAGPGDRAAFRP